MPSRSSSSIARRTVTRARPVTGSGPLRRQGLRRPGTPRRRIRSRISRRRAEIARASRPPVPAPRPSSRCQAGRGRSDAAAGSSAALRAPWPPPPRNLRGTQFHRGRSFSFRPSRIARTAGRVRPAVNRAPTQDPSPPSTAPGACRARLPFVRLSPGSRGFQSPRPRQPSGRPPAPRRGGPASVPAPPFSTWLSPGPGSTSSSRVRWLRADAGRCAGQVDTPVPARRGASRSAPGGAREGCRYRSPTLRHRPPRSSWPPAGLGSASSAFGQEAAVGEVQPGHCAVDPVERVQGAPPPVQVVVGDPDRAGVGRGPRRRP